MEALCLVGHYIGDLASCQQRAQASKGESWAHRFSFPICFDQEEFMIKVPTYVQRCQMWVPHKGGEKLLLGLGVG